MEVYVALGTGWTEELLRWFDANRRDLPWRRRPTPYRIWVSEIMLQQTRVAAAVPYFQRFLRRFPSVRRLARARLDDVLRAWEGLGYYSRARNLHRAARRVVAAHGGCLPRTAAELRCLPGFGPYTAAAVASMAFGEAAPVVDGNVIRVWARFRGIREDSTRPAVRRRIAAELARDIPPDRPGDFNQALMELGATVCVPRAPRCGACPLRGTCHAFREGATARLPVRPKARRTPTRVFGACVVRRGHDVLLVRRPAQGLWGGLWEFPATEATPRRLRVALRDRIFSLAGGSVSPLRRVGVWEHEFTHFRMRLHVFTARGSGKAETRRREGGRWVPVRRLPAYALPVVHRKIAVAVAASAGV